MVNSLSWRIVQASVVGTSHSELGEVCQDECFATATFAPDGQEYFVGVLSDGAGSASHGKAGAELACRIGVEIIEQTLQNINSSSFDLATISAWALAVRRHICDSAEAKRLRPRDFACTLLGALLSNSIAAFFQIGDGAIVVRDGDELRPVFWPDSGEYANMTHFVTDDDALAHLRTKLWISSIPSYLPDEIAMFSDGLQRLALVYQSQTVHTPFFEPMFSELRKADLQTCDPLTNQLARFLDSTKVNERTDDDKTLVLATRRGFFLSGT
jgi:protein phosphatase 2C-like protein